MTDLDQALPDELRTAILAHVLDGDATAADLARQVADVDGAEGYLLWVSAELPRFFAVPEGTAAAPLAAAERRATALLDAVEALQLAKVAADAPDTSSDAPASGAVVSLAAARASRQSRAWRWAGGGIALAAAAVALVVALPSAPRQTFDDTQRLAAELAPRLQPMGAAGAALEPHTVGYRNALLLWLVADDVPAARRAAAHAAALTLLTTREGRDDDGLGRVLEALSGDPCRPFSDAPKRTACRVGVDLLEVRAALERAPTAPLAWADAARSYGARHVLAFARSTLTDQAAALEIAEEAASGARSPASAIAAWKAITDALLEY